MKKYVVSLVMTKQQGNSLDSALRSIYIEANSSEEALGFAITNNVIKKLGAGWALFLYNVLEVINE